jgi:drug/metabolite transporter (DMT)-like permease
MTNQEASAVNSPITETQAGVAPPEKHSLHAKTYFLIGMMVVTGPVGNLLLAKSTKHVGVIRVWPLSELFGAFFRIFSSYTIWAGIACLLAFIVAYMLALSMADYSFVQPAAALGYGVVAVLGVFVLGEKVAPLHWAGIAVICLGVSFIRNTHPRTTENPD